MILLIISLLINVIIHEFAHLITAKRCGCKTEVFSIGFGKPVLWKKKINGTIYQITPWLLGGYCKLKGELELTKDKHSFANLKYSDKVAVALAGVLVNMLMGEIIFMIGIWLNNYSLTYFGYISFLLGLVNTIPFPALDGSYIVLFVLEKIYGKKKGLIIIKKTIQIGYSIITALNIVCVVYIILNYAKFTKYY